jgi:uncharacterized protein with GYD domain
MATYVILIQFTDQGIRNIKDTVKRGDGGAENGYEDRGGILDDGRLRWRQ